MVNTVLIGVDTPNAREEAPASGESVRQFPRNVLLTRTVKLDFIAHQKEHARTSVFGTQHASREKHVLLEFVSHQ